MKYLVVVGDGMSGLELEELGGKTTLEAARTPAMDALAGMGELGMVQNVPPGMLPGSDVANLSILGLDPRKCYTGRAPLEALSMGIGMEPGDWALRCNLVTVSEDSPFEEATLLDHSGGEISTGEAAELLASLRAELEREDFRFYTGTGYRHICLWRNGCPPRLAAPHDHVGERIAEYLPAEPMLRRTMERSFRILNEHPVNRRLSSAGQRKANGIWFWGAGTKPALEPLLLRTGKTGAMISAVALLKGIGTGLEMAVPNIPGADGTLHTDYEAKANAAVDALLRDGCDLAYIHLEAPDEMGHQGRMQDKIRAIEALDSRILAPVRRALEEAGVPHRVLILPDHPTPVCLRRHTAEPVPYVLYDSTAQRRRIGRYCEAEARASGIYEPEGWKLMERFLGED